MKSHQVPLAWATLTAILLLMSGCRPPDQRLEELTKSSLEQQSRQSEAVAGNARQIAEATRELVKADADAREHFAKSSQKLQTELAQGYERIDQAREDLEAERKAIAAQRQRDPVIAEAIGGIGLLVVTIAPLALVGLLLYMVSRAGPDEAAVSSLLISEVTSDQPRLLSREIPRLGSSHSSGSGDAP